MTPAQFRQSLIAEHFLRPGLTWLFIGGPWHGSAFSVALNEEKISVSTPDGVVVYNGELRGSEAHPWRLAMLNPTPEQLQDYRRMTEIGGRIDDAEHDR